MREVDVALLRRTQKADADKQQQLQKLEADATDAKVEDHLDVDFDLLRDAMQDPLREQRVQHGEGDDALGDELMDALAEQVDDAVDTQHQVEFQGASGSEGVGERGSRDDDDDRDESATEDGDAAVVEPSSPGLAMLERLAALGGGHSEVGGRLDESDDDPLAGLSLEAFDIYEGILPSSPELLGEDPLAELGDPPAFDLSSLPPVSLDALPAPAEGPSVVPEAEVPTVDRSMATDAATAQVPDAQAAGAGRMSSLRDTDTRPALPTWGDALGPMIDTMAPFAPALVAAAPSAFSAVVAGVGMAMSAGAGAGAVQFREARAAGGAGERDPRSVQAIAEEGASTSASMIPFAQRIFAAFGAYAPEGARAHVGAEAAASAEAMGAQAYATGSDVVFGVTPSVELVAHELAHVVQQQLGVVPAGMVSTPGDRFERQADEVAARVARGESVEDLFDALIGQVDADADTQVDAPQAEALAGLMELSGEPAAVSADAPSGDDASAAVDAAPATAGVQKAHGGDDDEEQDDKPSAPEPGQSEDELIEDAEKGGTDDGDSEEDVEQKTAPEELGEQVEGGEEPDGDEEDEPGEEVEEEEVAQTDEEAETSEEAPPAPDDENTEVEPIEVAIPDNVGGALAAAQSAPPALGEAGALEGAGPKSNIDTNKLIADLQGDVSANQDKLTALVAGHANNIAAFSGSEADRLLAGKDAAVTKVTVAFDAARERVIAGADAAIATIEGKATSVIAAIDTTLSSETKRVETGLEGVAKEVDGLSTEWSNKIGAAIDVKQKSLADAGIKRTSDLEGLRDKLHSHYKLNERDSKGLAAALKKVDELIDDAKKKTASDVDEAVEAVGEHRQGLTEKFVEVVAPVAEKIRNMVEGQAEELSKMAVSARGQVESMRDAEIETVETTRTETLGLLDQGEAQSVEQLETAGEKYADQLGVFGQSLAEALSLLGGQVSDDFAAQFNAFDGIKGANVEPDALAETVAGLREGIATAYAEAQSGLAAKEAALSSKMAAQVDAWIEAFDGIAALAETNASGLAAGAEQTFTQRVQAFDTAATQLGDNTATAMAEFVNNIIEKAQELRDGANTSAKQAHDDLLGEIDALVQEAMTSLTECLDSLETDIRKAADDEAEKAKASFWSKIGRGLLKFALFVALAVGFVLLFGTGGWALLAAGFLAGFLANALIMGIEDFANGVFDWKRLAMFSLIDGLEGAVTLASFGKGKALVALFKHGGDMVKNTGKYGLELLFGAREFDWGDFAAELGKGALGAVFSKFGDGASKWVGNKMGGLTGKFFGSKFGAGANKVSESLTKGTKSLGEDAIDWFLQKDNREKREKGEGFNWAGSLTKYAGGVGIDLGMGALNLEDRFKNGAFGKGGSAPGNPGGNNPWNNFQSITKQARQGMGFDKGLDSSTSAALYGFVNKSASDFVENPVKDAYKWATDGVGKSSPDEEEDAPAVANAGG